MDKNNYEAYEYLPESTGEPEPDQFFVVQDDGTFLLNRQIQYVAQVQDVKEVLEDVQPCTVYGVGVASQQFFVDVDNSAELISVSDQFILPEGDNGLYTNSYLLQPSSSTAVEPMEQDVVVDQFKEPTPTEPITHDLDNDLATYNCKPENNFTEITLSDEQYRTLEQKGWILLESSDKIFVLNAQGLHDITTNEKLIQKLRNDLQNSPNSDTDPGALKVDSIATQYPNLVAQPFPNQNQDTVEFVIGSNEEQDDTIDNFQFIINDDEKENTEAPVSADDQMYICDSTQETEPHENINEIATIKQQTYNNGSTIKINTKYNFKDIPDKIILGKTVNGKKLVAKVVKTLINRSNENKPPAPDENVSTNSINDKIVEHQPCSNSTGISETELVSLIHAWVRGSAAPSAGDVAAAHSVITQLLNVHNLKASLRGHKLIITKTKNCKDEHGVIYNKNDVALVTGEVPKSDDGSAMFKHVPDLLQDLKLCLEEDTTSGNQHLECIDYEKDTCTIFHVHITETKCADNVVRVSVTLNKRQLSLNQMFDVKKRYPDKVFGCSACASLFKSEDALYEHQDKDCLDEEEMLTIDVGKKDMVDAYAMIKAEKDKQYACTQCGAKFPRFYTCMRHVKTHLGLQLQKPETTKDNEIVNGEVDEETQKKAGKKYYKCKMCSSTYFHPATLSKHIVARHIKVKAK